jgi:adenylosuccinate lyase
MGGDRQKIHEKLRVLSSAAWEEIMAGKGNTFEKMIASQKWVTSKLTSRELHALMDPRKQVGDASSRCDDFVKKAIDPLLAKRCRKNTSIRTEY